VRGVGPRKPSPPLCTTCRVCFRTGSAVSHAECEWTRMSVLAHVRRERVCWSMCAFGSNIPFAAPDKALYARLLSCGGVRASLAWNILPYERISAACSSAGLQCRIGPLYLIRAGKQELYQRKTAFCSTGHRVATRYEPAGAPRSPTCLLPPCMASRPTCGKRFQVLYARSVPK
jgi:hypothetical protein